MSLEREAERRLARGDTGILKALGRQFERALIVKALARIGTNGAVTPPRANLSASPCVGRIKIS